MPQPDRKWGDRSLRVRASLDKRLQLIMDRVLTEVGDLSLISGYRSEEEQNGLFLAGKSQLEYPQSKHNRYPSVAVDFQPYPRPEREEKLWASLAYLASAAIFIGQEHGVTLRWGGDWNRNGDLTDNNFDDLFHLEIVECESDCLE